MKLCDACLAKHPELCTKDEYPHDFDVCNECLQPKQVRFVFDLIKTVTVTIPACHEHMGFHQIDVTLAWVCPICGGKRGEIYKIRSYDGSRSMVVDGWGNACGHLDLYADVREEAQANGLNVKPVIA